MRGKIKQSSPLNWILLCYHRWLVTIASDKNVLSPQLGLIFCCFLTLCFSILAVLQENLRDLKKFFYYSFIWLCWVFTAVHGLLLLQCLLLSWSSGSRAYEISSCGARDSLSQDMWGLSGPGIEPVFPALAGRFLTSGPPGKSPLCDLKQNAFLCLWNFDFLWHFFFCAIRWVSNFLLSRCLALPQPSLIHPRCFIHFCTL